MRQGGRKTFGRCRGLVGVDPPGTEMPCPPPPCVPPQDPQGKEKRHPLPLTGGAAYLVRPFHKATRKMRMYRTHMG